MRSEIQREIQILRRYSSNLKGKNFYRRTGPIERVVSVGQTSLAFPSLSSIPDGILFEEMWMEVDATVGTYFRQFSWEAPEFKDDIPIPAWFYTEEDQPPVGISGQQWEDYYPSSSETIEPYYGAMQLELHGMGDDDLWNYIIKGSSFFPNESGTPVMVDITDIANSILIERCNYKQFAVVVSFEALIDDPSTSFPDEVGYLSYETGDVDEVFQWNTTWSRFSKTIEWIDGLTAEATGECWGRIEQLDGSEFPSVLPPHRSFNLSPTNDEHVGTIGDTMFIRDAISFSVN